MSTEKKDKPNLEDTLAAGATISTRIPPDSVKPTEMDEPSVASNTGSIKSTEGQNHSKKSKSDPPPELIQIPGYTFIDSLHASKRTIVFQAREDQSGQEVALKQFKDEKEYGREKEIQKLLTDSDSGHENLLLAYKFLDEQRTMISPYLRGGDLHALPKIVGPGIIGVLKPRQTMILAIGLLDGLWTLHNLGIVHRDVKSRNVLVDIKNPKLEKITAEALETGVDLNFKLCDYEFAKFQRIIDQNEKGKAIGTPRYMAPEACLGEKSDPRSDIYGAGIIFYRLLAGCYPFNGEKTYQVMRQQIEDSIPDITQFNTQMTPGLKTVLEKALAKKPKDRYQSAKAFQSDWISELTRK